MKHLKQMYAPLLMTVFTMPAFSGDMLAPPSGARKLFEFGADGVQIYTCKMKDEAHLAQGFAYAFDGPEAVLFDADGKQAGTHGKGPEWVLGDGSSVTGEVLAKQPSPKPGAIPWLLLKVKSHAGAGKTRCRGICPQDRYGWRRRARGWMRSVAVRHDGPRSLFGEVSIFWKIDCQSLDRTPECWAKLSRRLCNGRTR